MEDAKRLKVFYDGGCPICSREIGYYQTCNGSASIDWVDVASVDEALLPPSLDREQALARFHVQTENGETVSGAAAFIRLWNNLERFRWIGWMFGSRPSIWVLDRVYDVLLKVRPRLQKLF